MFIAGRFIRTGRARVTAALRRRAARAPRAPLLVALGAAVGSALALGYALSAAFDRIVDRAGRDSHGVAQRALDGERAYRALLERLRADLGAAAAPRAEAALAAPAALPQLPALTRGAAEAEVPPPLKPASARGHASKPGQRDESASAPRSDAPILAIEDHATPSVAPQRDAIDVQALPLEIRSRSAGDAGIAAVTSEGVAVLDASGARRVLRAGERLPDGSRIVRFDARAGVIVTDAKVIKVL